jgi:hypothetical protein
MSRLQRAEENRARAIKERSVSAHSTAGKVEMARLRKAEMEVSAVDKQLYVNIFRVLLNAHLNLLLLRA